MNKKMLLSLFAPALFLVPVRAQQAQEEERVKIPFEFPAYREATVTMMFGSKKQVEGNIYLDGSKFYYLRNGKPIEADLFNIHRIQFGDTVYIPVDTMAARIVAQKGDNMLVCLKTIDRRKMQGRNDAPGSDKRGEGMAYFQLDMFSSMGFMELNNMEEEKNARLFPLKREYYYFLNGQLVPAKEGNVMKRYDKAQRKSLRVITENRRWSWKDENSLVQLLEYL